MRGCQIVIHLAAPTGNIAYSRAHPASQFRDCSADQPQRLRRGEGCRGRKDRVGRQPAGVSRRRVAAVSRETGAAGPSGRAIAASRWRSASCSISPTCITTNFDLNAVTVLGANAYGPHDHFDGMQAHVIPSTIVKCLRDEDLVVWGDGTPTRDFLFVDDLAEGVLLAAERLEPRAVVNLASGTEISIADLVRTDRAAVRLHAPHRVRCRRRAAAIRAAWRRTRAPIALAGFLAAGADRRRPAPHHRVVPQRVSASARRPPIRAPMRPTDSADGTARHRRRRGGGRALRAIGRLADRVPRNARVRSGAARLHRRALLRGSAERHHGAVPGAQGHGHRSRRRGDRPGSDDGGERDGRDAGRRHAGVRRRRAPHAVSRSRRGRGAAARRGPRR